jgi:hypothetical protein
LQTVTAADIATTGDVVEGLCSIATFGEVAGITVISGDTLEEPVNPPWQAKPASTSTKIA